MEVDFKSRNKKIREDDDRERNIVLTCEVVGIEQDYVSVRAPRNSTFTLDAFEDSIGSGLEILYHVSLAMIQESLVSDDGGSHYNNLGDVTVIYDLNADDENRENEVHSEHEIKTIFARKLLNLQIGGELLLSFDDHEVVIRMNRK